LLSLSGDRVYTGRSDTSGAYTVSGVPAGDYTLTPSKSDDVNGITAYDASLVLQHDAGLTTLTGHAAIAADVNKSGVINSMDAFYILQKAVDLITLPFPGAGVVWDFDPQSRTYTNLNSNLSGQDFTAILLGDVSGNWSAGGSTQAAAQRDAEPVRLTAVMGMPDPSGMATAILHIDPERTPVYGLELDIHYTQAMTVSVEPASAAERMALVANTAEPGRLRIALASTQPITTSKDLLRLALRLADPGSPAALSLSDGVVNEGEVPIVWASAPAGKNRLFLPLMQHQ
ncbi:MAG: hypothetical protein J7M34_08125, partial [Anaerolineae bacterium]|nr:hypothetical protein [Anaerolineae bacterium]